MAQLHRVTYVAPGPSASSPIASGSVAPAASRADYHDRSVAQRIAERMEQKGYVTKVDTIWA